VRDRLADVRAPAVVLHRREDRAIPFALGRDLAAALPDAGFVALEGADHYPWFGDTDAVARAMLRALDLDPAEPPPAPAASPAPEAATDRPPASSSPPPAAPASHPDATRATDDLTERETEVLTLVAIGLSDREIAERLVLSPHTVHRHVANVRTKLGLPTRAAAVAAAARRGLL
jgi:DNA-binding CsgD family transcriptional regulator